MGPLRWNGLFFGENLGQVSLAGYLHDWQRRKRGSQHPCNAAIANALQHAPHVRRGNVAILALPEIAHRLSHQEP